MGNNSTQEIDHFGLKFNSNIHFKGILPDILLTSLPNEDLNDFLETMRGFQPKEQFERKLQKFRKFITERKKLSPSIGEIEIFPIEILLINKNWKDYYMNYRAPALLKDLFKVLKALKETESFFYNPTINECGMVILRKPFNGIDAVFQVEKLPDGMYSGVIVLCIFAEFRSYKPSTELDAWGGFEESRPHDDWAEFEDALRYKEADLRILRTFLPKFKDFLENLGFNHIVLPQDPTDLDELKLPTKGDFIIFFQQNFLAQSWSTIYTYLREITQKIFQRSKEIYEESFRRVGATQYRLEEIIEYVTKIWKREKGYFTQLLNTLNEDMTDFQFFLEKKSSPLETAIPRSKYYEIEEVIMFLTTAFNYARATLKKNKPNQAQGWFTVRGLCRVLQELKQGINKDRLYKSIKRLENNPAFKKWIIKRPYKGKGRRRGEVMFEYRRKD